MLLTTQDCGPTEKAKLRVHAEAYLKSCLNEYNNEKYCLQQVATWCREHHLENSCGTDDLWTQKKLPY